MMNPATTLRTNVIAGVTVATLIAGGSIAWQQQRDDTLTRVIDGDTIVINGNETIRLWGIDAPELDQQCPQANHMPNLIHSTATMCGQQARTYLMSFFKPQVRLKCDRKGKDIYERTIAQCFAINLKGERHDIGKSLVAYGWAVDYARYSKGHYAGDEHYARLHKLGVWSGGFAHPEQWRATTGDF